MAEFLPWSVEKSVEYASAGRGKELIAAYEAGFRVSPNIIHYLLQNDEYAACEYFYALGFRARHETLMDALRKKRYHVVVWYHNHSGVTTVWSILICCYEQNGIPGVEALYQLGFHPALEHWACASRLDDKDLPFLEWMCEKGCNPCNLRYDFYNLCISYTSSSPKIEQFLRSCRTVQRIA